MICRSRLLLSSVVVHIYPDELEGRVDALPQDFEKSSLKDKSPMGTWLTNLKTLESSARAHGAESCLVTPGEISGFALALWISRNSKQCDAIVLYQPRAEAFWLCFLRLFRRNRPLLFFVDNIFTVPGRGVRAWAISRIRSTLYTAVDGFFLPQRDVKGICRNHRLKDHQFEFVQFKVNGLEKLGVAQISNVDYVMAGGKSRRDYGTFCKAMSMVSLPAKVVLPKPEEAAKHETSLDEASIPKNVSIVRHDENPDTWARIVAEAYIVVVPIDPGSISASGVSLYMLAMALGKPVVITESCATRGILLNKVNAMVVPPRDPAALAKAIGELAKDKVLYAKIAQAGREYALLMGGEPEYMGRIAAAVSRRIERARAKGT